MHYIRFYKNILQLWRMQKNIFTKYLFNSFTFNWLNTFYLLKPILHTNKLRHIRRMHIEIIFIKVLTLRLFKSTSNQHYYSATSDETAFRLFSMIILNTLLDNDCFNLLCTGLHLRWHLECLNTYSNVGYKRNRSLRHRNWEFY